MSSLQKQGTRVLRGLRRRLLAPLHLGAPHQLVHLGVDSSVSEQAHVLFVGPALVSVPPKGWGAVETIIAEQVDEFVSRGIACTILNSPRWLDWFRAKPWTFESAIVHYEHWLRRAFLFRRFSRLRVIAYSHYGLLEFPDRWDRGYAKLLKRVLRADIAVALNSRIAQFMEQQPGRRAEVLLAPNGSSFSPLQRETPTRGVLVLGKVEPRKRQFETHQELARAGLDICFVGPIVDERVLASLKQNPDLQRVFVGPWDRGQLRERMSEFRLLLLNSLGEADALVLYEAQLAGLEVLVSRAGLGAQDAALPWVHVLDAQSSVVDTVQHCLQTPPERLAIREYAAQRYRWRARIQPLFDAVVRSRAADAHGLDGMEPR